MAHQDQSNQQDFQILHHGAVQGVTGSCHQLVIDAGNSVLVDCGLFQGKDASAAGASAAGMRIDFDVDSIRALLVTHCHVDHVGRIPYLLAAGFPGPIVCTRPTAHLLPLVLEDALLTGVTRDRDLIHRVLRSLRQGLVPVPYGEWRDVPLADGAPASLAVRFQPAGHILGSAYVECRLTPAAAEGGGEGDDVRVVFSGDLGGPDTPLLPEPAPPERADLLVLESTYGDREHEDRAGRVARLKAIVERCFRDRGVILIPAFSIGRTQELLYELEQIIHDAPKEPVAPAVSGEGEPRQDPVGGKLRWQDVDVIVDSPLAARFTDSYRELKAWWDEEAREVLREGRHPLSFEQMLTIDSHDDHLKVVDHLRETARPAIVIAASGMCAGGRIVDYLKALIGDPRTDILFVGYQAEGTPGRDIQTHGPDGGWVELDGKRLPIRAAVHTLAGYSAHGDRKALVGFVRGIAEPPRQVRLIHGDPGAKAALQQALRNVLPPATDVTIP